MSEHSSLRKISCDKQMKKSLFIIVIALLTFSCKEEKVTTNCERDNTFEVKLTNETDEPYKVFINEKYIGSILAKRENTYNVPAGTYKISVKQAAEYILYPKLYEWTGTHSACEQDFLTIPYQTKES